jgi:hypothetical protein
MQLECLQYVSQDFNIHLGLEAILNKVFTLEIM